MKFKFTLLLISVMFYVASSFATSYVITFSGLSFNPSPLNVMVGDTVTWQGDFTSHPLSTTTGGVPVGAATISNVNTGTTYSYPVLVAGTYNYKCDFHNGLGMHGTFTATGSSGIENAANNISLPLSVNYFDGAVHVFVEKGNEHSNYDIRIGNILGEAVASGTLRSDEQEKVFAIQDQPKGVYVIAVKDENRNTFVRKFSIQ